jgi:DNA-binding transcriptional ArsR family regulator
MSNFFHMNVMLSFPLPKSIFTLGKCPAIKGSALTFYAYLGYLSQERSKASVRVTNDELRQVLGMTKNTVVNARAVLEDAGFIRFARRSNGYIYSLVNLETVICQFIKNDHHVCNRNRLPGILKIYEEVLSARVWILALFMIFSSTNPP